MKLRTQTFADVIAETPIHNLPVAFEGTPEQCREHASREGFIWKDSGKMLFGGWFYKTPQGKDKPGVSLLPTL